MAQRPPPPAEPRSLYVPIAGTLLAGAVALSMPLFGGDAQAEEAASAPAQAAEIKVTMTVRTNPAGATVRIKGEVKGTTPCDIELPDGEEVELRIEKEGFVSQAKTLTPEIGMEPLDIGLEASPFVLVLRGLPEGADIRIDGTRVEDPSHIDLDPALEEPASLEVRAAGYVPFEAELNAEAFGADRQLTREVTLERRRRRRERRVSMAATAMEAPAAGDLVPTNPF